MGNPTIILVNFQDYCEEWLVQEKGHPVQRQQYFNRGSLWNQYMAFLKALEDNYERGAITIR